MTPKQTYKLKTKHRKWILEIFDRPDAVHVFVRVKGPWFAEEEMQFLDWMDTIPLPFKTKEIVTTFEQSGEVITHYPNGTVVNDTPGKATVVNICEPP